MIKICNGKIQNLFSDLYHAEYVNRLEEHKLLRTIKARLTEKYKLDLRHLLLYGFFAFEVIRNKQRQSRIYRRMQKRIYRCKTDR